MGDGLLPSVFVGPEVGKLGPAVQSLVAMELMLGDQSVATSLCCADSSTLSGASLILQGVGVELLAVRWRGELTLAWRVRDA